VSQRDGWRSLVGEARGIDLARFIIKKEVIAAWPPLSLAFSKPDVEVRPMGF